MTKFSLAVHGGAGTILRHTMTDDLEARYHAGLRRALQVGHDVLAQAGSAMDAVTAAVCVLEDEPLFNAGRGAVFTAEGRNELDAAFMDGPGAMSNMLVLMHRGMSIAGGTSEIKRNQIGERILGLPRDPLLK